MDCGPRKNHREIPVFPRRQLVDLKKITEKSPFFPDAGLWTSKKKQREIPVFPDASLLTSKKITSAEKITSAPQFGTPLRHPTSAPRFGFQRRSSPLFPKHSLWTLNTMKNWPQEGFNSLFFELILNPKHDEELATRGVRKSTF